MKAYCTECEKEVEYQVVVYHNAERSYDNGRKVVIEKYYYPECKQCGAYVYEFEYILKNHKQVENKLGVCFVTMIDAMFNGERDALERKSAEVIKECK